MRVSRPDGSGFLEGLDASSLARAAFSDKIDDILSRGTITPKEARVFRRVGRFQTVRLASHGENLYQDAETGDFWELKEGTVVRLVGVDEAGIAKEATEHSAGGSTGYYRSKRMEQNPGTFNDGAGEKSVGKFGDGGEDDEDLETESAIGMQPDVYYQNKPFNRDEGPGHAQTAAADPFKKDEWVVDQEEKEYQVALDQKPDGSVEVTDDKGNTAPHPMPQTLTRKEARNARPTTATFLEGLRENQVADLIDFSFIGLPDAGSEGKVAANNPMREDNLGFLGEMDVSDIVAVTHREEADRILSAGKISKRAVRVLRRVGRLEPLGDGMYRDTITDAMWTRDDDGMIRRAELSNTASSKRSRTAAWDVIESVLARSDGWSPEFQVSGDRDAPGIHLENPTADDVVDAIHAARTQGYSRVHVH